jgi:pyrophosphatase PpaX
MTNVSTILFDLDGTLIDTTNLILACFDHSWQTVTGRGNDREKVVATFGMPLRNAMALLASEVGHPESTRVDFGLDLDLDVDLIERLLLEYRSFNLANHDGMVQAFPGTHLVLAELRARGYRLGVVTSKGRELGRRGLALCALDGFMDVEVFLEDTDNHKPRPEPILKALEKLNASPNSAVYVGDSRHDLIAGLSAGVRTVAALWGPTLREALDQERPDFSAESISDLLDIFD